MASFLPPESLVCLTLTCKHAVDILGLSSWTSRDIRAHYSLEMGFMIEHRSVLLQLLLRDIDPSSGFVYCRRCNTLHPPLKPPREHKPTKHTKFCLGQDAVIDYFPQTPNGGYSLVYYHIEQAFEQMHSVTPGSKSIDLFSGALTVENGPLVYTMHSSAQWVEQNLIISHLHAFKSSSKSQLNAASVLNAPVRLCPHQTTTTTAPPYSRHTPNSSPNGPLLSHAISTTFPPSRRKGIPSTSKYRKPTPLEKKDILAADNGEKVTWRCRACPTKFRTDYSDDEVLTVRTWHWFGRDLYSASKYWGMFVRREGHLLGPKTRNSEFYTMSRSVPDFPIE
jgi:hypothetical protein